VTLNEFIEELIAIKEKYGGDIEIRKLKHLDYLAPIFKDSVVYNSQINVVEI